MGLIFSMVIGQVVFNTFFIKSFYERYKEDAMMDTFYSIKKDYDGTTDSLIDAVSSYEDAHMVNITVSDKNNLIYMSPNNFAHKKSESPYTRIHNMEKHRFTQQPEIYTQENGAVGFEARPHMILSGAFTYMDETIYVTIMLPTASIQSNVEIFTQSSMMISMGVLVISIVVSMVLGHSITKPIEQMEHVASKLSQLDFTHKAEEMVSIKELASLGTSINLMSEQLKNAIENLNCANHELKNDVDAQKQMEQMRRQFVANVSHEMKTPLALLQIYSANLKNNVEDIDKDYYCDTIIEETEYLDKMVSSMLHISAIESGLSKMDLQRQSISRLALNLIAKMTPLLDSFDVESEIMEEVYVMADEKYLNQAMKNYIINAIDHGSIERDIQIALKVREGKAVFSVSNKGLPLMKEDIPYLWDSFYRSDKARVRNGKNVGLGLHIVKSIMDKHDGTCHGENTQDGVVFSFEILVCE